MVRLKGGGAISKHRREESGFGLVHFFDPTVSTVLYAGRAYSAPPETPDPIIMPVYGWASVIIESASTSAKNSFWQGSPEYRFFCDDPRENIGWCWTMGPYEAWSSLIFYIVSGAPGRYNGLTRYPRVLGSGPWTLEFEDWGDDDWDDLICTVELVGPPSDTQVVIKSPDDGSSFITATETRFTIRSTASATGFCIGPLSDSLDWVITPGPNTASWDSG